MALTGIVVAQLGGPEELDDVEPFIRAIFGDPYLVPLPGGPRTRAAVSTLVAKLRGPRSRSNYAAIGGGSPIVTTTQLQADALAAELDRRRHAVVVTVAHRYSRPNTEDAVDALLAAGVDRIVLLPLFPQYSVATTGSSEAELRRVLSERRCEVELDVVRSWCEHPSYLDAQARLVNETLAELSDHEAARALLVFSAHGLPQRIVDGGDPYLEEIAAAVDGITERLERSIDRVTAYQSRAGPMRWVGPDVRDVVAGAPGDGKTWLCVVPVSFVSDHVETSYELDIELKAHAEAAGVLEFRRSRCLDIDPVVGPMLADIVERFL